MSRPPEPPPNPYVDLSLLDLVRAMTERRGDLMEGAEVTRRDLAQLLAVVERKLDPRPHDPNSPAHLVAEGRTLTAAFFPGYEREAQGLRWKCIVQAADAIGMPYEERSLATSVAWKHAADLAQRDDAGLREGLAILEAERQRRRPSPSGKAGSEA